MGRDFNCHSIKADFNDSDACDLDSLLHPAQAFEHPHFVVNDPDLTLNEKRAILASWASDACAPEAAPTFRQFPGGKEPVRFDDVMDALRSLDLQTKEGSGGAQYRRVLRKKRLKVWRNRSDQGEGQSLN